MPDYASPQPGPPPDMGPTVALWNGNFAPHISGSVFGLGAYGAYLNGVNVYNNAKSGGVNLMTYAAGASVFAPVTTVPAVASLWGDDLDTCSIAGMTSWKSRLWVADTKKRVFFSAILDHTSWDGVDYIDIEGSDAGAMTCVLSVGERLIMATTLRKYALVGDTPNDWAVVELEGHGIAVKPDSLYFDEGTVYSYPFAINTFNGYHEGSQPLVCVDPRDNVYYVATDGELYMFDGYHEYAISAGRLGTSRFRCALDVCFHDWKIFITAWEHAVYEELTGVDGVQLTVPPHHFSAVYDIKNNAFYYTTEMFTATNSSAYNRDRDGFLCLPLEPRMYLYEI
jgi:hypothetical protein